MNKDIMFLSNTLIYKNCLIVANDEIANSKLNLNFPIDSPFWAIEVLDPEKKVIFINIDNYAQSVDDETKDPIVKKTNFSKNLNFDLFQTNDKCLTKIEKNLIIFLCKTLIKSGLSPKQLVVLAVYNLFKSKLEKRLKVCFYIYMI